MQSAISLWNTGSKNRLDDKQRRLVKFTESWVFRETTLLDQYKTALANNTRNFISKKTERVHLDENAIRLLDPEKVINRGYTLTMRGGEIVKSVAQLQLNDEIETRFSDGTVKSKITKTK